MNIIIYAKNLELAPLFKKQIEQKFLKLYKFARQILSCRLDLSHDAHHKKGQVFRIEANLTVLKKLFRVVDHDFDLLSGIIKVREKLERAMIEYKEKQKL